MIKNMKINTLRTVIREFALEDAASVLSLNSDPTVTQYTADNSSILTLNDAQTVISNIWLREYALYGYGRWAVLDNQTHKVIGFCGLKYIPEVGLLILVIDSYPNIGETATQLRRH
ncbi:hypothetical protein PCIT_b0205 [Pseudoalteromonas citrea]|uniref:N-acetyltransferase domain-containing protein n=2 Tax=Pseudoalteromonas citrea TaxID=43655 RepID=A0AAD4AE28_9GAMM|nr:hypothetical protein PCIT_b0205 [Pseudoalteromonas citrea]